MTENPTPTRPPETVPSRGSYGEALRIGEILRKETVGGALLVIAAALAILWANSPWSQAYFDLREITFGYAPWHLELSLGGWAADGLLAVFFFLVGLELKREFVAGDLRTPRQALIPVAAAFGGVLVPALIFVAVNASNPTAVHGWAIPTATDIAFAVAVLAVIGSHLPSALRLFLLTLAVVDDLIAILIIAVFYTEEVHFTPLLWALLPLAAYAFLSHRFSRFFGVRKWPAWVILLPIGAVVWALVHASGIHATVAGVVLGFMIPVFRKASHGGTTAGPGLSEVLEHRLRPLSAGVAVPVFAFFSAGVALGGWEGFTGALSDPVALGILGGLVLGKPIGILATTFLLSRFTGARLDPSLRWVDMTGMGLLAGIGFTVSLLVTELSFPAGDPHTEHAKVAVMTASVVAALLASTILVTRNKKYKAIEAAESVDADADGVPDVYQQRG